MKKIREKALMGFEKAAFQLGYLEAVKDNVKGIKIDVFSAARAFFNSKADQDKGMGVY